MRAPSATVGDRRYSAEVRSLSRCKRGRFANRPYELRPFSLRVVLLQRATDN